MNEDGDKKDRRPLMNRKMALFDKKLFFKQLNFATKDEKRNQNCIRGYVASSRDCLRGG